MAKNDERTVFHLLLEAQHTLEMTQKEFGPALGASHRTAVRWAAQRAHPATHNLEKLAELLVPHDRALAEEAARYAGSTLEHLGLVHPPAPPPPPPDPRVPTAPEDLVDIVVCAAADHAGQVPSAVRPLVYTVFKRAREVGLTLDAAEKALAPVEPSAAKKTRKRRV
jgi:hypothetical protein